jgi:hypothetical protein
MNDRVRDGAVFYYPAIYKDVLRPSTRPLACTGERGHKSSHTNTGRLFMHLNQIITTFVELKEPVGQSGRRRTLQQASSSTYQTEPNAGMGKR